METIEFNCESASFAVFTHSDCGDLEQLTHWDRYRSALKSKESWYDKDIDTLILARII